MAKDKKKVRFKMEDGDEASTVAEIQKQPATEVLPDMTPIKREASEDIEEDHRHQQRDGLENHAPNNMAPIKREASEDVPEIEKDRRCQHDGLWNHVPNREWCQSCFGDVHQGDGYRCLLCNIITCENCCERALAEVMARDRPAIGGIIWRNLEKA